MPKHAKTPIKTRTKILKVAHKLFNTQGFEQTKMQDIITHLLPYHLTKGAIYHHFKNKEDILYALLTHYIEEAHNIESILNSHINGRDKLKAIILHHLSYIHINLKLIRSSLQLFQDSKAIAHRAYNAQHILAPILESLIILDNHDGSLSVAYSKAASEVLAWGVYVWLDIALYPLDEKSYIHKVRHFRMMCEGVGLSVIDEEIIKMYVSLWQELYKTNHPS